MADLELYPRQGVALVDQLGYVHCLLAYVVELEHQRIGEFAIRAPAGAKQPQDKVPGLSAPTVARPLGLLEVELPAFVHVLGAAGLAPALTAAMRYVEARERKHLTAAST
jgi:hypothetical protein